jgi:hypothetical protein
MRKKNLEGPIVFTRHTNLYTTPAGLDARCRDTGVRNTAYRQPLPMRPPATIPRRPPRCGTTAILHAYGPIDAFLDAASTASVSVPSGRRAARCAQTERTRDFRARPETPGERPLGDDVSFTPRVDAPPTHAVDRTAPLEPTGVIACTTRRGMPRRVRHAERRTGVSYPSSTPAGGAARFALVSSLRRAVRQRRLHRRRDACEVRSIDASRRVDLASFRSSRSSLSLSVVGVARPRTRRGARWGS